MIIGKNETDIKWTAEPTTNDSCLAKNLELNNNGELLLNCELGETKWSKSFYTIFFAISQAHLNYSMYGFSGAESIKYLESETITEEVTKPCYFMEDVNDSNLKMILGLKCLKEKSPKFIYSMGKRAISVNDLKCGVRNVSNEDSIIESEICWSATSDKLRKCFDYIHIHEQSLSMS